VPRSSFGAAEAIRCEPSDIGGNSRFSGIAAGSYLIHVRHGGFKAAASQVGNRSVATAVVTIRLELADVFSKVQADFEPVQVLPEVSENQVQVLMAFRSRRSGSKRQP
jgi:hypothetical protein